MDYDDYTWCGTTSNYDDDSVWGKCPDNEITECHFPFVVRNILRKKHIKIVQDISQNYFAKKDVFANIEFF